MTFASISASSSADLVAAITAAKIRVVALFLTVTTAAGTVKFQSGATTDLTGTITLGAGAPLVLPFNEAGWFETAAGAKLNFVLSSAGQVSGALVYQTVASPPIP
jgi:hypothetical protein